MSQANTFLCTRCRRSMCKDCTSIADEYADLLQRRTQALSLANHRVEELQQELERVKHKAALWEEMSKVGLPAVIQQWMDDKIGQKVG